MKYEPDWTGIRGLMTRHPGIHRQVHSAGHKVLAIAQSRVPVDTGALRSSGRVEDAGIQKVFKGEPRMTIRVVFHSRYAMDIEARTGFLSGALGRRKT
jgi:hypothetical protein